MYDILADLPLFKGVSRERMEKTVGAAKFHFLKYSPGELIFQAGQKCDEMAFILSGTVKIAIDNPDGRFSVSQMIKGPDVISPEFLFGKITTYPGTVTAVDTVSILRISKADYLNILVSDQVFLLNFANQLSMSAQKSVEGILAVSTGELPERIAFWISAMTQPRSFGVVLECRQRDLVALFGVPRTSLRAALEQMRDQDLLTFTPHNIKVLNRPALLALLHNHAES